MRFSLPPWLSPPSPPHVHVLCASFHLPSWPLRADTKPICRVCSWKSETPNPPRDGEPHPQRWLGTARGSRRQPCRGQMGFVSFWEAEAHGGRMLDVRPSARGSSESFQRRRLDWEPRALVPLLPSINHFSSPGFILSLLADDSAAV